MAPVQQENTIRIDTQRLDQVLNLSGEIGLTKNRLTTLRTEVALVTQEHHVFVGTVRDNIVLARDEQLTPDEGDAAARRREVRAVHDVRRGHEFLERDQRPAIFQ